MKAQRLIVMVKKNRKFQALAVILAVLGLLVGEEPGKEARAQAVCPEGEIIETCMCAGIERSSGYCCTGIWDQNACRVLNYGFEDWTGDADTTPGYPFGEYDLNRWTNHENRTEVLSNCNAWHAYNGDYFLYGNWYVIQDECLQETAGAPHLHLAENFAFGNNAGFDLKSSVPGNELYVRYKVRLGDGWKTNTNHMVKFIRIKWVGGGYADYYSNLIMYSGEGNYITAPGADESAWSGLFDLDDIGIDLSDGDWHDFACWLDISDLHNTVPGPLKVKVWVDSILIIEREVPVNADYIIEYRPVGFDRMGLLTNFCGTSNDGPVTFGYDNLEVWDEMPNQTDLTPPTRSNPSPTGELTSSTTQTTLSLTTNENATCKYGTLASVPYDEMADTFSTTGETSHSTTVTGLEDGESYTYYVRCQDTEDNANIDDYPITFSIARPSDGELVLHGAPANQSIHLNWTITGTLPTTSTWQLAYDGPPGDQPSPIAGIISPTRVYTLTGLTNYTWYTVTLNAMLESTAFLTDTVRVMPTDIFIYLPLVLKGPG